MVVVEYVSAAEVRDWRQANDDSVYFSSEKSSAAMGSVVVVVVFGGGKGDLWVGAVGWWFWWGCGRMAWWLWVVVLGTRNAAWVVEVEGLWGTSKRRDPRSAADMALL